MFERIGVWTNTGRPFKQAVGSSWPFCVSKAAGRCQHWCRWLLWGFSQLGADDYLNTPSHRPSLLSFPASHVYLPLSLAFRVSSSSVAEPFSSGAVPQWESLSDLSGLLFPCDSGTSNLSLSLFLSSFFLSSHAPRFPSFKHRAHLSPYRHLNGWGLLFLFHNERTISSFDEKSISLEGLEGFHGVFFSYFWGDVICMLVWPLGPILI